MYFTVCLVSHDPFYEVSYLYKMSQDFLDIQYSMIHRRASLFRKINDIKAQPVKLRRDA